MTNVYTECVEVREALKQLELSFVDSKEKSIVAVYEEKASQKYEIHIYDEKENNTSVVWCELDKVKPVIELITKVNVDSEALVIGELSDVCAAASGVVTVYKKVIIPAESEDVAAKIEKEFEKQEGMLRGIIFANAKTLMRVNEYAMAVQSCYEEALLIFIGKPVEDENEEEYIEVFLFE